MLKKHKLSYAIEKCISLSVMGSYAVMGVFWVVTGCRYGIKPCINVMLFAFKIFLPAFFILLFLFCILKYFQVRKIKSMLMTSGFDDEFYKQLNKALGRLDSSDSKMIFAYALAEGGRHGEFMKDMKSIPFMGLSAYRQEEYFNLLLYDALLRGDMDFADEVFRRGSMYIYRGARRKGGEHIRYTLGLYCIKSGDYYFGIRYIDSAKNARNRGVRCKSLTKLCEIYLEQENYEMAKRCAVAAVRNVSNIRQGERLRGIMLRIQNIYGISLQGEDRIYDN